MMNFITFQLKKRREDAALALSMPGAKNKKTQQEKAKARKEKPKKESVEDEDSFYGFSLRAMAFSCWVFLFMAPGIESAKAASSRLFFSIIFNKRLNWEKLYG